MGLEINPWATAPGATLGDGDEDSTVWRFGDLDDSLDVPAPPSLYFGKIGEGFDTLEVPSEVYE